MAGVDDLRRRVVEELDRCAVGRDNRVHRALVAGELPPAVLHELARQQWLFHAAFPGILAALAAGCPDPPLRARILADAYEQETGALSGVGGRLELWEAVCACWGIGSDELRAARPLPTTEAMLALQASVARRPFVEAYVGLEVGVYGESAPHMAARRAAMERQYGVSGSGLDYFSAQTVEDQLAALLEPIGPLLREEAVEPALAALRLVLHGRWNYFTGIGCAASGRDIPE